MTSNERRQLQLAGHSALRPRPSAGEQTARGQNRGENDTSTHFNGGHGKHQVTFAPLWP